MKSPLTLQAAILTLQDFWASQGCVIWQPYHTEVGAGTMNPATFLRVLGPEPWRVAYVEPSIRPADGRYGENPNRWQHYYQFQVILKPDPGDPQEIYLRSLEALGVDQRVHDIRFVEDKWEAPALGAWGLGWEVWLDGQEITQYTYFQAAGGIPLDPVSVEITYGLERIVMAIQGARSFLDVAWNEIYSYGDVALEAERQHCIYNFEKANIERLNVIFQEYQAEAESALDAGLVFPALDYILKCSHIFNLLDARGAVGVAERAALFARMRDLSRRVAQGYLEGRQALGFPWLQKAVAPQKAAPTETHITPLSAPAPFLLEIGTEELPPGDFESATQQLEELALAMLDETRLEHGALRVMGTPRRLVLHVEDLAPQQSEEIKVVKGPPEEKAFDAQGKPTQAAVGFARSRGIAVEALQVREVEGGRYVVGEVREAGQPAAAVLAERLPALIGALRFEKAIRWDGSGVNFARPIRWLLALHGESVVPFHFAGLLSGRGSRGMRFSDPSHFQAASVEDYLGQLKTQGIVLDVAARRDAIWKQVTQLAAEVGGTVRQDAELLAEVVHMVEIPTALRGSFEEEYLSLPAAVLIGVMKEHQRYFPVEQKGALLPYFIALRNGGREHLDVVRYGNEQVIRARFADAAHFVKLDLQKPLEEYLPKLASLTFHAQLGSMLDKVQRLERLVKLLGPAMGLDTKEQATALRIAHLCKADLATRMVVEMTSLQGAMGREYARRSGETEAVAQGIWEHYLPRAAGDALPASAPGTLVGIADRVDTLVALFGVGAEPSGAKDPFALRRTAIGLVQLLAGRALSFDLRRALGQAAGGMPFDVSEETLEDCLSFIATREQILLLGEGHRHDAIEALLAAQAHDPACVWRAVEALEKRMLRKDWPRTLQAYARCARIIRGVEAFAVDSKRLEDKAEKALYDALLKAEAHPRKPGSVEDFFKAFLPLVDDITRFFDEVLVMAEQPQLRENRLALLQRIVALADGVADLSCLEGF